MAADRDGSRPMSGILIALASLAAIASWAGVGLLRRALERWRVLDVPNHRSSHSQPTPRGGGFVMVLVTGAGLGIAGMTFAGPPPWGALLAFAGLIVVAIVSGIDNFRPLPSLLRLSAHA